MTVTEYRDVVALKCGGWMINKLSHEMTWSRTPALWPVGHIPAERPQELFHILDLLYGPQILNLEMFGVYSAIFLI